MSLGRAFRLAGDARPRRYAIRLALDLDSWTFAGRVALDVVLGRPRRELVLHCRDLDLSRVSARYAGIEMAPRVVGDEEAQAVVLRFASDLPAGPLEVAAEFSGRIRSDLKALYRSTRGRERYAIAILFPSEARRVFPCFDEPTFKARFALELEAPSDLVAISNGRLLETIARPGGRALSRFAETPPLSTYLLMFAVGPFDGTAESATASGTPVRVWLPAGLAGDGRYAHDAHRRAVEWLEAYTAIAYPYDKVEGVGVPDFPAGAMENPGAITYRLDLLAVDPERTATARLKSCVSVVSHELTHMWWGDLATLAWWDDIWLNESFATFVGHKAENAVHPEWNVWRDFALGSTSGFALDALVSTHAIHSDAATAEEALQRFDAVSYQKGATVLRMIESYLGEEAFRKGVRVYLERHREGNASAPDFWRALDDASGEDVTRIASSWITEPGHPLVELRLLDETRVELRQRRFFLDSDAPPSGQRWPVPLTLRTAGGPLRFLLEGERGETRIPHGAWVHPNAGATGFYRFSLDARLRDRLLANVGALEPAERLLLADNEWALLRAGAASVAAYFALLDALRSESDRAVLRILAEQLRWLAVHAAPPRGSAALASRAREMFAPPLARVGWDAAPGERDDDREIRAICVRVLGELAEAPEVRAEAARRVAAHLDGQPEAPDLVGACLRVAAATGSAALATRYLARFREANDDPQEQRRILDAVASFRDGRATELVIAALFDGTIRDQDLPGVLFEGFRNAPARAAYWRAFRERYAERIAPLEAFVRQGCVGSLAQLSPDPIEREVEAFLQTLGDPDMREVVARTRESLRLAARSARAIGAHL